MGLPEGGAPEQVRGMNCPVFVAPRVASQTGDPPPPRIPRRRPAMVLPALHGVHYTDVVVTLPTGRDSKEDTCGNSFGCGSISRLYRRVNCPA